MLLIRGELLRRYPDTIIYAQSMGNNADVKYPLFQGSLGSDITFFGLPFTRDEAVADPGYYIVLQQHPTAPRFGLDETGDSSGDPSWDKVDVVNGHASVGAWAGNNSAATASATLQLPVRMLIPASAMLPPES